jgi:methionine aminopeptidase
MSPVQEDSPANDQVLQNYQSAAELANNSLSFALNLVKAGASVMEICRLTDEQLITTAGKNFEKVRAGIAFPCCLSVNNVLCYNAPADVESDSTLKDGDLIKIELGAHVDGFPTLVGTSIIVGAKKEVPATGKAADLVHAANIVAKVALCLLQAGKSSTEIANILKRTTKELGVSFVEGMISHLVGRNTLAAGNKMIIVNPSEQQAKSVETCELKVHDIFVIDIALSAGDG